MRGNRPPPPRPPPPRANPPRPHPPPPPPRPNPPPRPPAGPGGPGAGGPPVRPPGLGPGGGAPGGGAPGGGTRPGIGGPPGGGTRPVIGGPGAGGTPAPRPNPPPGAGGTPAPGAGGTPAPRPNPAPGAGGTPAPGAGGAPAPGAGGAPAPGAGGAPTPVTRVNPPPPAPPANGAQVGVGGGGGPSTIEYMMMVDMAARIAVQTGMLSQDQYDDINRYANDFLDIAGDYYDYFDDILEQADEYYKQYTGESLGLQDVYNHYTNEVIDSFERNTGLNLDDFENYEQRYNDFTGGLENFADNFLEDNTGFRYSDLNQGALENFADNFLEDNTGFRYSDFNEMKNALGMGFDSTLISQFKKNMYNEGYKAGYKFKEPKNSTLKKLINYDSFLSNQINTGKIPEHAKRDYRVLLASNRALEKQKYESNENVPFGNIAEIEGMGLKKRKYKKKSNL